MSDNTSDQIRDTVTEYTKILNKMTELNKDVKTLRDSKKEIEEEIMDFMDKKGLSNLKIGGETFTIKEKVKNKTFSKQTLVKDLLNFMDQHQVDSITSRLFTEEEAVVTKVITHKKS